MILSHMRQVSRPVRQLGRRHMSPKKVERLTLGGICFAMTLGCIRRVIPISTEGYDPMNKGMNEFNDRLEEEKRRDALAAQN